jgi:hypothetical protein
VPHLHSIVLFCRDVYVQAPFWSTALGLDPVPADAAKLAARTLAADESVLLTGAEHPDVWVTPVRELDPPGNRLHLDLATVDGDVARLVEAGARVVRVESGWAVLADPEGNEFCALDPGSGAD